MSQDEPVILDASPGGVAVVLLNRPERRNALNADVIAKLSDVFETLRGSDDLRCVILRANGPSFSAGADIEYMQAAAHFDEHDNFEDALALAELFDRIYRLEPLTVALVQGACMGGAAGLVAACDVAIAEKGALFRFPEVRLGIIPAVISPFVVEAVGPRAARALFATGETVSAAEAHRLGLVTGLVDGVEGFDAEMERLSKLAFETAPGAVAAAKALVRDVAGKPVDHGLLRHVARAIAQRRASEEGKEGLSSFLEKRKPSWAE
ncbi:MAG: enoyl-CoA hydratase-related protein [Caulobacterales bacterium]|nr:enoyl-CoA hydratase-related protein [Caulobacterales bacterium]